MIFQPKPNRKSGLLKLIIAMNMLIIIFWLNTVAAYAQPLPPQFVRENINVFMTKPARIAALTRGIQVMKQRPASDPTSWAFQAKIHGTVETTQPLSWNQCQHRHWWFLAWHRAYLYYLERMLQKAAAESRLRVPYWNYTDPTSRSLPAPFLDASSPLFTPGRLLTAPTDEVTASSVNISTAMSRTNFVGSDAQLGFGGGQELVMVQFPFENKAGSLEKLPHNAIHVQVGGLMQNPSTAALDPIFWLHHCNIDRLWEAWLRSGQGRANPTNLAFLNSTFTLYNENGVRVTHQVKDFLVNTQQLGYYYDDQPIASVATQSKDNSVVGRQTGTEVSSTEKSVPITWIAAEKTNTDDMNDVGAPPPTINNPTVTTLAQMNSKIPVKILANPFTIQVQSDPTSSGAKRLLTNVLPPDLAETQYLLVLEDIDFTKPPTNLYDLYLNLPTADYTTMGQTKYYIGPLSFFEAEAKHTQQGHHESEKRSETFDITEVIHALQRDRALNPNDLTVTIVPVGIMKKGKPTRPVNPIPLQLKSVKIVAVQKQSEKTNSQLKKEDDY